MSQIKLTALLFGFFLMSTNVPAVEVSECEDEEGERSYQLTCPPGSTTISRKNYSSRGASSILASDKRGPVVLYLQPDCSVCERVKEFITVRNVPITVKNVMDSAEVLKELESLTGGKARVPFLVIGEQLIPGFDDTKMMSALKDTGYLPEDAKGEADLPGDADSQ